MGDVHCKSGSCPLCAQLRLTAVEAAVEIGVRRLAPADVLERAEATPAQLAGHSGSVEALLVSAYRETQEDVYGLVSRAWRQPLPPSTRMAQGLAVVLRYLAARPLAARFRVIEARRGGPRLLACHDAAMRAYVDLLRRRMRDDGPPLHYELIIGAISRVVTERVDGGEIATLPDALPEAMEAAAVFAPELGDAPALELVAS